MTDRHFLIYADESDKQGRYYSNFFGGALLAASDRNPISAELDTLKADLGLIHEVKWQYVDQTCVDRYIDFIRHYFDYIRSSRIKIRIMFTQNMRVPENLSKAQKDNQYFLLYYQFIKHAFGLRYSDHSPFQKVSISILADKIPDTRERVGIFKDFLCRIPKSRLYLNTNLAIPRHAIADVDSRDHVILQGLDLVLGAICARLNNKFREVPPGKTKRGKRTLAKEKLYKAIYSEIRTIYPNFNVGVSTACANGPEDRWRHPYRHWLFLPARHTINRALGKRAAPEKPT